MNSVRANAANASIAALMIHAGWLMNTAKNWSFWWHPAGPEIKPHGPGFISRLPNCRLCYHECLADACARADAWMVRTGADMEEARHVAKAWVQVQLELRGTS